MYNKSIRVSRLYIKSFRVSSSWNKLMKLDGRKLKDKTRIIVHVEIYFRKIHL